MGEAESPSALAPKAAPGLLDSCSVSLPQHPPVLGAWVGSPNSQVCWDVLPGNQ